MAKVTDPRIIAEKKIAIAAAEAAFKEDVKNGQINMMRIGDIRETRGEWSLQQRIKEIRASKNYIDRDQYNSFCREYINAYMFRYSALRRQHFTNLYQLHGQNF